MHNPLPYPVAVIRCGVFFCDFLLVDCKNVYQSPSNVI